MAAELSTSGDDFSVNGGKITDLAAGVDPTDAANVSQIVGGSGIPASIFDAKGDLIVASAADTAARLAVGANDTVPTAASGEATGIKWQQVGEAMIALTDETTLNATTGRHGFLKKLDNSAAHFMDGQGNWSTPAGTSPGVAADTIWDAAGDIAIGTGADTATRLAVGTTGKILKSNGTTLAYTLPAAHEFDYAEITGNISVTATAAASATTVVSGNAVTYDGSTIVLIEFFAYAVTVDTDAAVVFNLYDGSTDLGRLGQYNAVVSGATTATIVAPPALARRLTPSNAAHTFHIKAWKTAASTCTVFAGAGGTDTALPAFIRITKV